MGSRTFLSRCGANRCDAGLNEESFVAYDDEQDPPVTHFFASYLKPAEAATQRQNHCEP